MAFPSTVGTKPDTLDSAWTRARSLAGSLKQRAQNLNSLSLAGVVPAGLITQFCTLLADTRDQFAAIGAVPGLGAYAQEQVGDVGLNVATEFAAMTTAIDNTSAWIVANFPASGGFLLASSFDGNGRVVERTFDSASLAGFRTQLAALIATID